MKLTQAEIDQLDSEYVYFTTHVGADMLLWALELLHIDFAKVAANGVVAAGFKIAGIKIKSNLRTQFMRRLALWATQKNKHLLQKAFDYLLAPGAIWYRRSYGKFQVVDAWIASVVASAAKLTHDKLVVPLGLKGKVIGTNEEVVVTADMINDYVISIADGALDDDCIGNPSKLLTDPACLKSMGGGYIR
jgi:hypothetical protein